MEILAGFIMGIMGSFHCLGMCGPIVLAVPARSDNKLMIFIDSLAYNIGRTITYGALGAFAGLIGASINLAGYQNDISIITGILLLVIVLIPKKFEAKLTNFKIINTVSNSFKKAFGKIIGKKSLSSLFGLGILNGFLPCGLVYLALTASIASGGFVNSILFMLAFGIGTLPMMAILFVLKSVISLDLRRKFTKLIPVGVIIVALLLITRGMSLGIPYISPKLPETLKEKAKCCGSEEMNKKENSIKIDSLSIQKDTLEESEACPCSSKK